MASYSIVTASSGIFGVTFTVRGLNRGDIVRFYVRHATNTSLVLVDTGTDEVATGSSMTRWFSLPAGEKYVANVGVDTGSGNKWIGSQSFSIGSSSVDPPVSFTRFDWTYAGLDVNGNVVYGSTKRSGLGIYVTAAEWNELAALVRNETGKSVSTVNSGRTISASVVNTMAKALGVPQVSSGSPITASFFNNLRSAYNALG